MEHKQQTPDQQNQDQQTQHQPTQHQPTQNTQASARPQHQPDPHPDVDGLADKKPDELTPDELRLMADTMPGEGPGD